MQDLSDTSLKPGAAAKSTEQSVNGRVFTEVRWAHLVKINNPPDSYNDDDDEESFFFKF